MPTPDPNTDISFAQASVNDGKPVYYMLARRGIAGHKGPQQAMPTTPHRAWYPWSLSPLPTALPYGYRDNKHWALTIAIMDDLSDLDGRHHTTTMSAQTLLANMRLFLNVNAGGNAITFTDVSYPVHPAINVDILDYAERSIDSYDGRNTTGPWLVDLVLRER